MPERGCPGLPDHQVLEGRRRVQVPGERPSFFALIRSRLRFLSFSWSALLLLFSQILMVVCAMRRQGGRDFAALKKFVESTLL